MMRNCYLLAIVAGLLVVLAACDGSDQKVKDFVGQFAAAVSKGDLGAVEKMFPDAKKADSLRIDYNPDSVVVNRHENDSLIEVTLAPGVDMVLREVSEGQFMVCSSHGLFAYPETEKSFARQTGQWKDGLTDAEQAERMADKGLVDYLYEQFNAKVKNGLRISDTQTYGDDYYQGEWMSSKGMVFTVKNSTDIPIPGSAWSITYKEGYWGGGEMATETVAGKDVEAGGSVTVRTQKLGSSMESETGQYLNVKGLSKEEFMASFKPTGKEFDEYQKQNREPQAKVESLEFTVQGDMGGCPTRLSMYGDHGLMMYRMNNSGPEGGSHENRDVKLVSYDPATAQLVIRVIKDGTPTGKLVGTYRDGVYQGSFQNVNGKSSAFLFK